MPSGMARICNAATAANPRFYVANSVEHCTSHAWRLQQPAAVDPEGLYGQILLIDLASPTVVLHLGQRTGQRHWPGWIAELLRLNP